MAVITQCNAVIAAVQQVQESSHGNDSLCCQNQSQQGCESIAPPCLPMCHQSCFSRALTVLGQVRDCQFDRFTSVLKCETAVQCNQSVEVQNFIRFGGLTTPLKCGAEAQHNGCCSKITGALKCVTVLVQQRVTLTLKECEHFNNM